MPHVPADNLEQLAIASLGVTPTDAQTTPSGVTRPIVESISEAMDAAPMGYAYDIVYAALARRMKKALSPGTPLNSLIQGMLVNSAVNFRAVNAEYANVSMVPSASPQADGTGDYQSKLWGRNKDDRLPYTATNPLTQPVLLDPSPAPHGVSIAKLFFDVRNHLPCVLFNVTAKTPKPVNVGGSAVSGRSYDGLGNIVTQYTYHVGFNIDATIITQDETACGNLQACFEATFGVLRDKIDDGAYVSGKSWSVTLPLRLQPSPVTETDAPWAASDGKDAKIYVATVAMEDVYFECTVFSKSPVKLEYAVTTDDAPVSISLKAATNPATSDAPLRVKMGSTSPLVIANLPLSSVVDLDMRPDIVARGPGAPKRRVGNLVHFTQSATGYYEFVAMRQGECDVVVFAPSTAAFGQGTQGIRDPKAPELARRRIIVSL